MDKPNVTINVSTTGKKDDVEELMKKQPKVVRKAFNELSKEEQNLVQENRRAEEFKKVFGEKIKVKKVITYEVCVDDAEYKDVCGRGNTAKEAKKNFVKAGLSVYAKKNPLTRTAFAYTDNGDITILKDEHGNPIKETPYVPANRDAKIIVVEAEMKKHNALD